MLGREGDWSFAQKLGYNGRKRSPNKRRHPHRGFPERLPW
jgi:hypothetical protein